MAKHYNCKWGNYYFFSLLLFLECQQEQHWAVVLIQQTSSRVMSLEGAVGGTMDPEQHAQGFYSPTAPSGPSSSSVDSVGSAAIEVERGRQVVFIQQTEKVPKFSGNLDRSDSLTIEEWIELVEIHIQTKPTEKEKALWVYNHLEGTARIEIKYLPRVEKECVDDIFRVLREIYGCLHSHISLQRRFFNRKQQEGESLLDYSHALMTVMDQIVKSNELAHVKSQRDLRDQFCDGVRDQNLGVRLRDQVRAHPNWTIRDVRREAVQWMAQCEGQSYKQKQNDPLYFSNEAQVRVFSEPKSVNQCEYSELRALIEAQQSQLDSLMKALSPLKIGANVSTTFSTPRSRKAESDLRCFRCDQLGHIARYCLAPPQPRPAQIEKENVTQSEN